MTELLERHGGPVFMTMFGDLPGPNPNIFNTQGINWYLLILYMTENISLHCVILSLCFTNSISFAFPSVLNLQMLKTEHLH